MKAVRVERYGDPEVLTLKDVPEPAPAAGELLLSVRAAGVNFADVLSRLGVYESAPPRPFTPGIEVSGTVEAAGAGSTGFRRGDRVAAFCTFGGYAERVAVPVSAAFKIPDDMTFSEAAALPVQYLTAYHGLFHLARLQGGERLLLHAAAGGVGIACLQLARHAGAEIHATVGSREKEAAVLRECPLAKVYLYSEGDFSGSVREATAGEGVHVVMDSVGGRVFRRSWGLLSPGGRYILYGASSAVRPGAISKIGALWRLLPMAWVNPLSMISANRGLFGFNLYTLAHERKRLAAAMDAVMHLRAEGVVQPRVSLSLPLEKAAEAHRRLQGRSTQGKIVLTVG